MSNSFAVKEIQDTFDINSIYAQRVFDLTRTQNFLDEAEKIINEKPKPFVKWVGGKRQLLKQFRMMNLYPPEKFNPKTGRYFEPFVVVVVVVGAVFLGII